jgi:hypothetical protein
MVIFLQFYNNVKVSKILMFFWRSSIQKKRFKLNILFQLTHAGLASCLEFSQAGPHSWASLGVPQVGPTVEPALSQAGPQAGPTVGPALNHISQAGPTVGPAWRLTSWPTVGPAWESSKLAPQLGQLWISYAKLAQVWGQLGGPQAGHQLGQLGSLPSWPHSRASSLSLAR